MIQNIAKGMSTADQAGTIPSERRKTQGAGDADFTAQLLGAAGMLVQPGIQQSPQALQPQQEAAALKNPGEQALRESSAEKSPLTMKPAVSLNTAAMIAGPKPWSKEWVFEGIDPTSPEMKTLLEGAASSKELETLQKATREMIGNLATGSEQAGAEGLQKTGGAATTAGQDAAKGAAQEALASTQPDALMSGELHRLDPKGELSVVGGQKPVLRDSAGGNSGGLSGAEFLNTLSTVRAGQDARQNQSQMGGQGGQSGRKAGLDSGLRVIEGGLKGRKSGFDEDLATISLKAGSLQGPQHLPNPMGGVKVSELTGHVVQGAMAQERLSSESLVGLSTGIRNAGTDGEIRVRLRPDHLGELHLRVMTQGNRVGLQIQASDDKARKIIEDSIGFLKESLATHQLSLGQVDVSVASAANGSQGTGDFQQQQQQPQHGAGTFTDLSGQNPGWNRNGQDGWGRESGDGGSQRVSGLGPNRASAAAAGMSASTRARSTASSGRLDVMA